MEKYGRVLVIIFFLCLINLGLTVFTISKLNKSQDNKPISIVTTNNDKVSPTPTPKIDLTLIQSDLTVIKAEIRSIRELLTGSGLIIETPAP